MSAPTNPTARSLAERAIASPHWRWMEGAHNTDGDVVVAPPFTGAELYWFDGDSLRCPISDRPDSLPDLDDPATLGCVEAMVLEAHGPLAETFEVLGDSAPDMGGWGATWVVRDRNRHIMARGRLQPGRQPLKPLGLVAALEAAP